MQRGGGYERQEEKYTDKKRKKQVKVRWEKLENEYISSKISYKDLADKYKITQRQVEKYGSENNWVQKRRDFVGEVSANVKKSLIQSETDKQLGELREIGAMLQNLKKVALEATKDEKQFYKRVWFDADTGKATEFETSKFDTQGFGQMVKAVEKLTDAFRDVYNIVREDDGKQKTVNVNFTLPKGTEEYGD